MLKFFGIYISLKYVSLLLSFLIIPMNHAMGHYLVLPCYIGDYTK